MSKKELTKEELTEYCEIAFINVKEACKRLQEQTMCSNDVVVEMLKNVAEYYDSQVYNSKN